MHRKLRMGMVGGGRGAFIGAVHRMAAALDGQIELVAGAFSADPEKSRQSGNDLFLDPGRVYASYQEMAHSEAQLPEERRIDFVSIVTRNDTHAAIAEAFLKAGFNVVCEKPMTQTVDQALTLQQIVHRSGKVFALTHNYTGYPMVKEAREMVRQGKLGHILKIVAEYPQGYALPSMEKLPPGHIANWRMDPACSGSSNCMGDIGTHAENLGRYITGLEMESVCADLSSFIPSHSLDDDGNVLVRYKGGARGILYASQISAGEENNLSIRVYGSQASLEWHQEDPNELVVKHMDGPRQIFRRGNNYLSHAAKANSRLPFGHPEAFIEAFANIYLEAAKAIRAEVNGQAIPPIDAPNVEDGVMGMRFIAATVASARSESKWTPV